MKRIIAFATRPHVLVGLIAAVGFALAAAGPAIALAAPSNTATVQFGNPNAPGADENCIQNPAEPCANAFHKLIPGAVTIDGPGTVTFQRVGFHQVAVYKPGTSPSDIEVLGGNRVNDDDGLLFRGQSLNGGSDTVAFSAPGRYLVICNLTGHWNQNMWGWVVVR